MAKEQNAQPTAAVQTPAPAAASTQAPAASSLSVKKILMIGMPMFLLQVVVIYFLMAKFISHPAASAESAAAPAAEKPAAESAEPNLFVIKDIIVNPAGTNGSRFLLATIGIDVSSPEALQELTKKEVQVRDLLNTVLSEKTLPQLTDIAQREQLRTEIMKKMEEMIHAGKMKNIYFSKFIIQ